MIESKNTLVLLRVKQLAEKLNLSRSTIYKLINEKDELYDPTFPKGFLITPACRVWFEHEVLEWALARSRSQRS